MILRREILPAFAVIGMEGSTREGEGFVARLWEKANARFDEIAPLISGTPRLWGLMTGPNRDFMPWEDGFSRGLYLAGVEAPLDALPPEGWAKWISPAYEYAVCPMDGPDSFAQALADLPEADAQALLRAGLIDELEIHLVQVLLGDGRRLFDHLGGERTELELVRRLDARDVTHLRYRVRHGAAE